MYDIYDETGILVWKIYIKLIFPNIIKLDTNLNPINLEYSMHGLSFSWMLSNQQSLRSEQTVWNHKEDDGEDDDCDD